MSFFVDIVILSNVDKSPAAGVECRVGLPTKNPWSLPFAHKKLFAERCADYDLFIYSEDDILVTERNLRAWLAVNAHLNEDEIPGFLRVEYALDGKRSFPDAHGCFHWDPASARRRGPFALAHFTNEHAACYVLDSSQLQRALRSGGFVVPPHEEKYDMLCTAATDVYTQCGMTKLVPISCLDDFTVHHMSNRYAGKMGVSDEDFVAQTQALLQIEAGLRLSCSLLPTETRLWRAAYSKDYYEPVQQEVTNLIPDQVRSVLSIGCGIGRTEAFLSANGRRVSAIPLDGVISTRLVARGIELLGGDLESLQPAQTTTFDCVLCLNILHLVANPVQWLALARRLMHRQSVLIIQAPNMASLPTLYRYLKEPQRMAPPHDYSVTGSHFSSVKTVTDWCERAGLDVSNLRSVASDWKGLHAALATVGENLPGAFGHLFAPSVVFAVHLAHACRDRAA